MPTASVALPRRILLPATICHVPLVADCYGARQVTPVGWPDYDFVCRIGYSETGDNRRRSDLHYPAPDVGCLWFRRERNGCASGMLRRSLFSTEAAVHAVVRFLAHELGVESYVGTYVELVETSLALRIDGERGLQMVSDPREWHEPRPVTAPPSDVSAPADPGDVYLVPVDGADIDDD